MGIYNCADTLPEAVESILAQTFSDWELILCDDGSSDGTFRVAEEYRKRYPEQIILLRNERNMGLNHTLNRCLERAEGEYIARMDGDDVSLPERLKQETAFLDENPDYAIVSSPMIYFDERGEWGRGTACERPQPMDFAAGTPFCHAPCMVRRQALQAVGGYSTDRRTLRAEDYHLWFRLYAAGYRGYNLQTPYYKMRDDENACRRRRFRYALNEAYVRLAGYRMLGLPLRVYPWAARPILVALLPKGLYRKLHHRKQRGKDET